MHKTTVSPEKVLEREDYRWLEYASQTGLPVLALEDTLTGAIASTTIANPATRVAAQRAWAGARHSRSSQLPWEILQAMGAQGIDPDQKIEETFRGYGHSSVGDMARLTVDLSHIPMHMCLALFSEGTTNSGQEKSTRYQTAFGKAALHEIAHYLPEGIPQSEVHYLETRYQELGMLARSLFAKHQESLTASFTRFFSPLTPTKQEQQTIRVRALDCARSFLLLGQWSGLSYETSARDWSRLIGLLKGSSIRAYRRLAQQVETLLAPPAEIEAAFYKAEAPSLIRHTQVCDLVNKNLVSLQHFCEQTDLLQVVPLEEGGPAYHSQYLSLLESHYSEGERLLAEYLLLLWPGLCHKQLFEWIASRPLAMKRQLSALILSGHSNYVECPGFARTTRMTLAIRCTLGELRELNRHRAWGRFTSLPLLFGQITKQTVEQILAKGFGLPLYLTEISAFESEREAFEQDLLHYYEELQEFFRQVEQTYPSITYEFLINLLPLAQHLDLWMHGDPKQALYMPAQRVRPGGHINYRMLAWEANQLITQADPYLAAMQMQCRPDASSTQEFFDRS